MIRRIDFKDKNLIERGFTLVELLVVIVILGVLAAVVVFAVGGITNTSKASACQIEVRTVNTAVQAYYAQNSAYPPGTAGPAGAGTTEVSLIAFLKSVNLLATSTGSASSAASPTAAMGTYTAGTGVMTAGLC